jgi:hypothetical protein
MTNLDYNPDHDFEISAADEKVLEHFDVLSEGSLGQVIRGVARLDDALAELIKKKAPNIDATALSGMNLASKRALAADRQLLEKDALHDLRILGMIRNRFAHDYAANFLEPSIQGLIRKLKYNKYIWQEDDLKDLSATGFMAGTGVFESDIILTTQKEDPLAQVLFFSAYEFVWTGIQHVLSEP